MSKNNNSKYKLFVHEVCVASVWKNQILSIGITKILRYRKIGYPPWQVRSIILEQSTIMKQEECVPYLLQPSQKSIIVPCSLLQFISWTHNPWIGNEGYHLVNYRQIVYSVRTYKMCVIARNSIFQILTSCLHKIFHAFAIASIRNFCFLSSFDIITERFQD